VAAGRLRAASIVKGFADAILQQPVAEWVEGIVVEVRFRGAGHRTDVLSILIGSL
jgi:hypothetical protein